MIAFDLGKRNGIYVVHLNLRENNDIADEYFCMQILKLNIVNLQVYTDRSRVVLSALCLIVACVDVSKGTLAGPVERWAQLALRRYEAVSDSDLLLLYVPLLHTCISIW